MNKKEKIITRTIYIGIIAMISLILAVVSMKGIEKVPGNSFATEWNFIATFLLVFGLWLIVILGLIWLARFLANLAKSKRNLSGTEAVAVAEKKQKDFKKLSTAGKVAKWGIAAGCVYFLIMFLIMVVVMLVVFLPTALRNS